MRRGAVRSRPQLSGIASIGPVRRRLEAANPDLLRRRRRWLAVSAGVVLVALAGIAVRGLDLGVEFTGGRLIEYTTARPLDPATARQVVAEAGFPRAVVQSSGDGGTTVRAGELTDAQGAAIREAIAAAAGGADVLRDELIGPSLGEELRRGALVALGVALAAQLLYLAVRFRWTFSAGAVVALGANVGVVVGAFAWLGRPLDGVFLAALLTAVGYTVNDSVVVFDRIREFLDQAIRWGRRPAVPPGRRPSGPGDTAADDQHRPVDDGHPRGAARSGRGHALRLRARTAHRHRGGHGVDGRAGHSAGDRTRGPPPVGPGPAAPALPGATGQRGRRLRERRSRPQTPPFGAASRRKNVVTRCADRRKRVGERRPG